jgi:hypothetical protein
MLVPNQIVRVKWNWKSKDHWVSKGYKLPPYKVEFEVKAEDLQCNSNVKVAIECDKCHAVRIGKSYRQNLLCRSCSKLGTVHSEEHKINNSKAKKKYYSENTHHRLGYKYESPEVHPSWNPTLTQKDREDRRLQVGYNEWSIKVKQQGKFTCQVCMDNKGGNLVSHHLEAYCSNKELRLDVSNGICLCDKCHKDFHSKFGYGNNTTDQFEQYIVEIKE